MSIKLVLLLAGAAGLIGIGFGYFLRFIISLGKRGSVELEIKRMTLAAREQGRKKLLRRQTKKPRKHTRNSTPKKKKKERNSRKRKSASLRKKNFWTSARLILMYKRKTSVQK